MDKFGGKGKGSLGVKVRAGANADHAAVVVEAEVRGLELCRTGE